MPIFRPESRSQAQINKAERLVRFTGWDESAKMERTGTGMVHLFAKTGLELVR
jgi:hypothetical protein